MVLVVLVVVTPLAVLVVAAVAVIIILTMVDVMVCCCCGGGHVTAWGGGPGCGGGCCSEENVVLVCLALALLTLIWCPQFFFIRARYRLERSEGVVSAIYTGSGRLPLEIFFLPTKAICFFTIFILYQQCDTPPLRQH